MVATDLTPAMVDRIRLRAARLGREVDARVMDAHALEFPDGSFDAVILPPPDGRRGAGPGPGAARGGARAPAWWTHYDLRQVPAEGDAPSLTHAMAGIAWVGRALMIGMLVISAFAGAFTLPIAEAGLESQAGGLGEVNSGERVMVAGTQLGRICSSTALWMASGCGSPCCTISHASSAVRRQISQSAAWPLSKHSRALLIPSPMHPHQQ